MFYCNNCRLVKKWPSSLFESYGSCEICGKQALCNDVPSSQLPKEILSYEEWYDLFEESINIELAESGADRELDFDSELEFDKRYEKYICQIVK